MSQLEEDQVYGPETFRLHKVFGNLSEGNGWISDRDIIDYMVQAKQNAEVDFTISDAIDAIKQNQSESDPYYDIPDCAYHFH